MDTATVSLLLAGGIAIGFALAMLMLGVFSVIDTPWISRWRKTRLLRQLPTLRLHRQLQRLQIDVPRYTEGLCAPALKRQMRRCAACEAMAVCDQADGHEDPQAYCPNATELKAAAQRSPAQSR